MIQELKQLFDSLSRGTSGRIILEKYEEEKMRDLIERLFADELCKDN
jgi:hypothetical protein